MMCRRYCNSMRQMPIPLFYSAFRGISDMTGHADGFLLVENGSKALLIRHRVSHSGHRGIRKNSGAGRRVFS